MMNRIVEPPQFLRAFFIQQTDSLWKMFFIKYNHLLTHLPVKLVFNSIKINKFPMIIYLDSRKKQSFPKIFLCFFYTEF